MRGCIPFTESFYRRSTILFFVQGIGNSASAVGAGQRELYQSGGWSWTDSDDRYLIVVNLSDVRSEGQVKIPWQEGEGKTWR